MFWILVAKADHSEADCLVIILLTHGEVTEEHKTILTHELVLSLAAKDKSYFVHNIFQQFTDQNCPTLANKPKIFVIQSCQGDDLDYGVQVQTDQVDARPSFERQHLQIFRPQKDFLIAYASVPGFQSFRNDVNGSWFIQTLCDTIDKYKYTYDFLKILTITSHAVAYNKQSENENKKIDSKKQMPCIATMLTKQLLFQKK